MDSGGVSGSNGLKNHVVSQPESSLILSSLEVLTIKSWEKRTGFFSSFSNAALDLSVKVGRMVPISVGDDRTVYAKVDQLAKKLGIQPKEVLKKSKEGKLESALNEKKTLLKTHKLNISQLQALGKSANQAKPGEFKLHTFDDHTFITGKTRQGETVIAEKSKDSLAAGGSTQIYRLESLINSVAKLVLKEVAEGSLSTFEDEDKVLQKLELKASPHIIGSLKGRVLDQGGVIQEEVGANLESLIEAENRPSLEVLIKAVEEVAVAEEAHGIGNMDKKLANFALNLDGKIVSLDYGEAIDLNNLDLSKRIGMTVENMPSEGTLWHNEILSNLKQLDLYVEKRDLTNSRGWQKFAQFIANKNNDSSVPVTPEQCRQVLLKEYKKTVRCIERFQEGLLLCRYALKKPVFSPYKLGSNGFVLSTKQDDGTYLQNHAEGIDELGSAITERLSAAPFVSMKNTQEKWEASKTTLTYNQQEGNKLAIEMEYGWEKKTVTIDQCPSGIRTAFLQVRGKAVSIFLDGKKIYFKTESLRNLGLTEKQIFSKDVSLYLEAKLLEIKIEPKNRQLTIAHLTAVYEANLSRKEAETLLQKAMRAKGDLVTVVVKNRQFIVGRLNNGELTIAEYVEGKPLTFYDHEKYSKSPGSILLVALSQGWELRDRSLNSLAQGEGEFYVAESYKGTVRIAGVLYGLQKKIDPLPESTKDSQTKLEATLNALENKLKKQEEILPIHLENFGMQEGRIVLVRPGISLNLKSPLTTSGILALFSESEKTSDEYLQTKKFLGVLDALDALIKEGHVVAASDFITRFLKTQLPKDSFINALAEERKKVALAIANFQGSKVLERYGVDASITNDRKSLAPFERMKECVRSDEEPIENQQVKDYLVTLDEMISWVNDERKDPSFMRKFLESQGIKISIGDKEEFLLILEDMKQNIASFSNSFIKEKSFAPKLAAMERFVEQWKEEPVIREIALRVQKAGNMALEEAVLLTRQAYSHQEGNISTRDTIVLGRLDSGEVVVGAREKKPLGTGGSLRVYALSNLAAKTTEATRYVFKELMVPAKSALSREHAILQTVHAQEQALHVVSPLVGRVTNISGNVTAAIQEMEGKDIFWLLGRNNPNLPSIEVFAEGVLGARKQLREKGLYDLDAKFENFVLSRDEKTVKRIDAGGAFTRENLPVNYFPTRTLGLMPKEGEAFLNILIDALLDLDKFNSLTDPQKERLKKIISVLKPGAHHEREYKEILLKEYFELVEKIEDFQDGLMLWLYADRHGRSPYFQENKKDSPHSMFFVRQEKAHPFQKPMHWDFLKEEMQKKIKKLLDSAPFVEINNKLKEIPPPT